MHHRFIHALDDQVNRMDGEIMMQAEEEIAGLSRNQPQQLNSYWPTK